MSEYLSINEVQKQLGVICGTGKLQQGLERLLISADHHLERIAELEAQLKTVEEENCVLRFQSGLDKPQLQAALEQGE